MGLSLWLAAKNSRLGFQGGSFKDRDALEDVLPLKSVLCHVSREKELHSPGAAPSCLHEQGRQRGQNQTCAPKAGSAQLLPSCVLCPEGFGRAGMLAGHSGSGANLAQPGEGPGTNIILTPAGAATASPISCGAASASQRPDHDFLQKMKKHPYF